jgi:Tfp pilus assembly protein PilF
VFQAALFEQNWGKAEAIAFKETAKSIDLSTVHWCFRLALAQLQQGKNALALATLQSIPDGLDDLQKWSILALIYAQFGQFDLALKSSRRAPNLA